MTKKHFVYLASVIFLIMGIVHIVRLLVGWQVQIAGFMVPMWIYWLEAFVFLYLSFVGFKIKNRD